MCPPENHTGLTAFLLAVAIMLTGIDVPAQEDGSSNPSYLTRLQNRIYFFADDGQNGLGLWSTDGTESGTVFLESIYVPPGVDPPNELHATSTHLYFGATARTSSTQLWVSNGARASAFPLSTFEGKLLPNPRAFCSVGNRVYCSTNYVANEIAFTTSDGTSQGTRVLYWPDETGVALLNPKGIEPYRDLVILFAYSYSRGYVLVRTDGTQEGTAVIRDIDPRSDYNYGVVAGQTTEAVYFTANDGVHGNELWRTDGTPDGTRMVVDLTPGPQGTDLGEFAGIRNQLVFRATLPGHGSELYITDGTPENTQLLKEIAPGEIGSDPYSFHQIGDYLFFTANDSRHGHEPWVTDGTGDGTYMLADLNVGPASSSPYQVKAAGNRAFFGATVDGGDELCVTDGTPKNTFVVTELIPGPTGSDIHYLCVMDDIVYFHGNDGIHGVELWRSDGTPEGTWMVKDIQPLLYPNLSSEPHHLTALGSQLYFAANDATHGIELWRSSGTEDTTGLVLDIAPNEAPSRPQDLCAADAQLYFTADDGVNGRELWSTSPASGETKMVMDIHRGPSPSNPQRLIWHAGVRRLFFTAESNSRAWWVSDGTADGTAALAAMIPDTKVEAYVYREWLLFSNHDDAHGREIWRSDGTPEGTSLLADIAPGAASSEPHAFWEFRGTLYFLVKTAQGGVELWQTQGTPETTHPDDTILASMASSFATLSQHAILDGALLFSHPDADHGSELWRSDLSEAGTYLVRDIFPGRAGSSPGELTLFAGRVWFRADNGSEGFELWNSDGTERGTRLVRNIGPFSESASIRSLCVSGSRLYFAANGGTRAQDHGEELYSTDGGVPLQVHDIRGGTASSTPAHLTDVNGRLFFSADDGTHGIELWVTEGTSETTFMVRDILPARPVSKVPHGTTASGNR